jgi:hypothetical protein
MRTCTVGGVEDHATRVVPMTPALTPFAVRVIRGADAVRRSCHHRMASASSASSSSSLFTPLRLVVLLCLSPFLLMSVPLLLFGLPVLLAIYVAWQLFGPTPAPKKVTRSVTVGQERADAKEGAPHRNVLHQKALIVDKDGLTTIPQLMRATVEKFGSSNALGQRRLIKNVEKEVTVQVDGKSVTKMHKIPWFSKYGQSRRFRTEHHGTVKCSAEHCADTMLLARDGSLFRMEEFHSNGVKR